MNLNKVFVLGRLTRDPEKRSLPSGQSVVSLGMATNRFYNDKSGQRQKKTEFHNITAFGNLAETMSKYLTKGSLALIEGRLQTSSWEDAAKAKHYRTEIIAERLQLGPRFNKEMPTEEPPKEDIPVIEENEPHQRQEQEEIDVKDIPL